MNFKTWSIEEDARQLMNNFYLLINEIYDQYGKEIKIDNPRDKFEAKDKENKTYIKGFQGYKEHNPMIQSFSSSSPENFAQTLLFGPLTANTSFSRFNEWFPVLMAFLRKHDTVTPEMVGNFAASVHSQRKGIPGGGLFVSIIDRGERHKTKLISYVWNNREELKKDCDELAKHGKFKEILHKLSLLPGIQPVKAGFIVQLLYGQMGCLDTHNIAMYDDLAKQMQKDPSLDATTREKWKELGARLKAGEKTWVRSGGTGPKGEEGSSSTIKVEKAVDAYHDILSYMNHQMGFNPRVLWDLWCNYVAQRYAPKKAYSPHQGLAYDPKDQELYDLFGGKDRQWYNPKSRASADVINPHPASGAVSRVHLMAAITPDQLFDELEKEGTNNKFHAYNAALRSDPHVKSALQTLSNRLHDAEEIKVMVATGKRVNDAIKAAKENNLKLLDNLTESAKRALKITIQQKYPIIKPIEAEELVNLYTNGFAKLYKLHTKEIYTSIKSQDTLARKNLGTYVDDDEELGYGQYGYDPSSAFNIKSKNSETERKATNRTNALMARFNPYKSEFVSAAQSSLAIKKTEKELKELQDKLKDIQATWKSSGYEAVGGKESYIKERDKLSKKIKTLKDKLSSLKDTHKENMKTLSKKANAEIAAHTDVDRARLHGPRDTSDEDELEDEDF